MGRKVERENTYIMLSVKENTCQKCQKGKGRNKERHEFESFIGL